MDNKGRRILSAIISIVIIGVYAFLLKRRTKRRLHKPWTRSMVWRTG